MTLLETLVAYKVGLPFISWSRARFVVCSWKVSAQGVSPGSETITEAGTYRLDEWLVWMVLEKSFEHIDLDWSVNLKKICVVSNGFKDDRIQNFIRRRARQRTGTLRPLSSGR